MHELNPQVDAFIDRARGWQSEVRKLRAVLLDGGLEEEFKWRKPCYTSDGRNVAIIQPFRDHCSLMFFKGALLDDDRGLLVRPGRNSQAARRIQFTDEAQVEELEPVLRQYIDQAIRLEEAGLEVAFPAKHDLTLPVELSAKLEEDPELAHAFHALTPGRQRGYVLHVSGAKQSKTRVARIERAREKILAGKGFNER
jgi:uncharacterized protein YdeI (YjbR/CyaY-like superfamily)